MCNKKCIANFPYECRVRLSISVNNMKSNLKFAKIGIDEVGRGPIAGPVAVCAFLSIDESVRKIFYKVKESKQLSEKQREEWFDIIQAQKNIGTIDFSSSTINTIPSEQRKRK